MQGDSNGQTLRDIKFYYLSGIWYFSSIAQKQKYIWTHLFCQQECCVYPPPLFGLVKKERKT